MVDMPIEVLVAIIGAIQAIGVAIIGGLINRNQKEREKRDEARERRDACNYDLLFSVADGLEVVLCQMHGDKVNGNVEQALTSIRNAKSECNHLYNSQLAKL